MKYYSELTQKVYNTEAECKKAEQAFNFELEQKKKVEFQYSAYGIDKKLAVKGDGKFYKINPYFMVNNRGKYYLVCNYDKGRNSTYRIIG